MKEGRSRSGSPADDESRRKRLRRPLAEQGSRSRASRASGWPPTPALVAGATLLCQFVEAEAAIPGTSVIGGGGIIAALSVAIMTVRRTYDAVDLIISASEDKQCVSSTS